MKTASLLGFIFIVLHLGSTILTADEKPAASEDREIKFDREIWLKITPPCILESEGSKLTVYPQNIDFKSFVQAVVWQHGMPGYLKSTSESSRDFNFDLADRIVFKEKVILRIARTTTRVITEGLLRVGSQGTQPEILKR